MLSNLKRKAALLTQSLRRPAAPVSSLFEVGPHIEKYFGPGGFVLHEEISTICHIDVHVVLPSDTRPYYVLLTSGMSDRPMRMPAGLENLALAEVCLSLPPDWPISAKNMEWATPENYWPIALLKQMTVYPHRNNTWFSWGHTIGSVDVPEALDPAGRFVGVLISGPATLPAGAETLLKADGGSIIYLAAVPLLKDELQLARTSGIEALEAKLDAADVTELIDPGRKSSI
jgi:hypothetical protein